MTVLDSRQMDIAAATVAVHAFAAANLDRMMPRGTPLKPEAPRSPTMGEQIVDALRNQTFGSVVTGILTGVLGLLFGVCAGCYLKPKPRPKEIGTELEMQKMLQDE